ncbi:MAG: superoxide dismutase [Chlamydiae bacterium]|nr:superoxide dismutase [Chlamydiota bacterium]
MEETMHELPKLPYSYDALEPVISKEIMELHHKKHHNAYVTNLNKALEAYESAELEEQIALQKAIRFNGGGHLNHSIFWTNLAPQNEGGGKPPEGELAEAINGRWGSLESFIEEFNAKAGPLQGSGWCWLAYSKKSRQLLIMTCANQDPLFATTGLVPLLGIDVWEHAYYLQYKNARPEYLKNIWKVVNWANIAKRYKAATTCNACKV